MQSFWLDDGLCSLVQLHSVVSLVDAVNFRKLIDSLNVPKDEDNSNTIAENELMMR